MIISIQRQSRRQVLVKEEIMKLFKVSFGGKIAGSNDFTYLMENDENAARDKWKKMHNNHKLIHNFLNKHSRWDAQEVQE